MADQKISQLNTITGANVDDAADKLAIVDTSGNETKAITREELFKSVDGTTFHVDSTNNRVGIGTITPATALEVDGDISVSDAFPVVNLRDKNSTGTSIGGLFSLTNADGTDPVAWFGVPDEDGVVHIRAYYGDIALSPGSAASRTEVMRIQDNGRVGIGTTSPSATLDVVGDAEINGALATTRTDLTISAGAVTATGSYHRIDTEASAATDDLATINGAFATGHRLVITPVDSTRTIVVKDGTGNIILNNVSGDFTMDNVADTMELIWAGSNWLELSRSNNGA